MLAVLLLCGALVSCSKGDEEESGETTTVSTENGDGAFTRLDGVNYGGKTVTIHTRNDDGAINEIGLESYGDILSDALYKRTVATQERIGVTVAVAPSESWNNYNAATKELRTSISAGNATYDIIAGWSCRIISLAVEGYFHDLNTTAYYSSEDEWWSDSVTNALTVGGKIYLNTGDIAATYMDSCMAIAVNQRVSSDFGYEYDSFYDIVDSGDWTMEYFGQLVKDAYSDTGNGIVDALDKYGLVFGYSYSDAFWTSCGVSIIENNGVDRPTLNFDTGKVDNVAKSVYNLMYSNVGTAVVTEKDSVIEDGIAHFQKDLAMFTILPLGSLAELSTMETTYGVLPMPKYDKNQQNYNTYVQQSMSLWCIPLDATDKDMSSAVMTSMGYDSREMVIETHYETVLKVRYVKDTTSGYMIDLIYNGIWMNFDTIFNESLAQSVSSTYRENMPVYILRTMSKTSAPNAVAWWQTNESSVTTYLNNILDSFYGTAQ